MQISTEATKKMAKLRSFSSLSASRPRISLRPPCSRRASGGVLGRLKLYSPSNADAMAHIRKVLRSAPAAMACWESQPNRKLITSPAMIQPTVPHTLIFENSCAGSRICRNATAFTKANVGM